jgi:hypothetical protein
MNRIVRRFTEHITTSNPCFKQASQLCLAGPDRCPNRKSNQLSITLSAFLRATEHTQIGEVSTPSWLPASQSVTEHVSADEAHEMANDVFNSWCHKVAASHPEPS